MAELYGGIPRNELPDSAFLFPDDRSFPVVTCADVPDAAQSIGRSTKPHDEIKRRLIARARKLGCVASLPEAWQQGREMAFMDAAAKALADLMDTRQSARYAWIGISTTGLRDKLGDIIPSELTYVDVAVQTREIEQGGERPDLWYWNRATREYVHEHEINGPVFADYGALLNSHNMRNVIGRRIARVPVRDEYACLEVGWTDQPSDPATMSIGYRYASATEADSYPIPYTAVYSFEASRTAIGTEANPFTFFVCEPTDLTREAMRKMLWDNFKAAALGLYFPNDNL